MPKASQGKVLITKKCGCCQKSYRKWATKVEAKQILERQSELFAEDEMICKACR
jgi:hypothetical protein